MHKFCSSCYRSEFTRLLELHPLKASTLRCLNSKCCAEFPSELLQAVLPLPIAEHTVCIAFSVKAMREKKLVTECFGCKGIIALEGGGDFNQIACGKCGQHMCLGCRKTPHWPMKCEQSAEWEKKFEHQYELDCKRSEDPDSIAAQQNTISQQYSLICSQSRARRLDSTLAIQLAKNMRRVTNYKQERQFLELRRCALQLLEFGFGWLYMTRRASIGSPKKGIPPSEERPKNWAAIRSLLSSLNRKVEALESEILFSSSLTDPKGLLSKVEEGKALLEQAIQKFKQT